MENYDIVREQNFELISWKDTIDLSIRSINEEFDAIKLNWISYYTDTTGLKQIALRIENIDECNKSCYQSLDGSEVRDYFYGTYLDIRQNVLIFQENTKPPIDINPRKLLTKFSYEIYINNATSYAGITVLNPVLCEIAFLKKKKF